ncbi:MAG: PadR family transcriptional regulator [Bacillota bacterium]|nr:PadR family transcriptional regulator [Bacillota bacterium]
MIPLYILGLLQRYGPQHGYKIKKIISEQLSDFTQIKLPTIYYHLEKMAADGTLSSSNEKDGSRPEKTIYYITEKGIEAFQNMLKDLLVFDYHPSFPSDGVFYFSDYLEVSDITVHLDTYIKKLNKIITSIQNHKNETLLFVPDEMKTMVNIIFSHHERHYQAELDWASESLTMLNL